MPRDRSRGEQEIGNRYTSGTPATHLHCPPPLPSPCHSMRGHDPTQAFPTSPNVGDGAVYGLQGGLTSWPWLRSDVEITLDGQAFALLKARSRIDACGPRAAAERSS